jgi:probable F420-dependent oxidoreductase
MASLLIGLGVASAPGPGIDPVAEAIAAERHGFDFVSTFDHLHGEAPTYEPWTLLTTIAARTARMRVATRVLAIPYRNVAVLAKMSETLDRLSGGRLILGLGAGYVDDEFTAFGLGTQSLRDRVAGMAEAIDVLRGVWTGDPFTYEGTVHRVAGARIAPKPEHPIPIWLGTYGPRALAITGRLADGWIPSFGFAPPGKVVAMRDRVLAAAEAAGRDPTAITAVYNLQVRVDDGDGRTAGVVSGSPEAIADELLGFAGLGFAGFNFIPSGAGRLEQIDRLGGEVLPLLRSG